MEQVTPLPEPLIDAAVDLRDFPYMPLDISQMQKSETWAMASGDEAKAMVNLWIQAWHEVPAGSLANNDGVLATWSGAGAHWPEVRDVALRGFVLCSDNRLYHKIVVKKAREAWAKVRGRKRRTHAATKARQTAGYERNGQRNGQRNDDRNVGGSQEVRSTESQSSTTSKMPRPHARPHEEGDDDFFLADSSERIARGFVELRNKLWPNAGADAPPDDMLRSEARRWLDAGLDADTILRTLGSKMGKAREKGHGRPQSLNFFRLSFQDALEGRQAPKSPDAGDRPALASDRYWSRVRGFRERGFWYEAWGPKPGEVRCEASVDVLAEFGYGRARCAGP